MLGLQISTLKVKMYINSCSTAPATYCHLLLEYEYQNGKVYFSTGKGYSRFLAMLPYSL